VTIKDSRSLSYVRVVSTLDDGAVAETCATSTPGVRLGSHGRRRGATRPSPTRLPVNHLRPRTSRSSRTAWPRRSGLRVRQNLPISVASHRHVGLDARVLLRPSRPPEVPRLLDLVKDRAFVVSFDNEAVPAVKLTSRKDKLVRSLSGLRAEGSTPSTTPSSTALPVHGRQGKEGSRDPLRTERTRPPSSTTTRCSSTSASPASRSTASA
jgi:hypothetical protein